MSIRHGVSGVMGDAGRITIALGMLAGASCPALAQDGPQAATGGGVQDIVVTAQRREESLQKVPVSVTALSSDLIARVNIRGTQDLDIISPGLVSSNQRGQAQIYLRGIGAQGLVAPTENPVATYVDGVYYAVPTGTVFSFNNIQRLEVLRGPQGTLFGRNATGGVVQIVTRKPQQDFNLSAGVSYSNYDTATGNLYVSGGLTNTLSASLAAYGHHQDRGYGTNFTNGDSINRNREYAFQGQLLFEPVEGASFRLAADYTRQDNDLSSNLQIYPGARNVLGTTIVGGPYDATTNARSYGKRKQWGVSLHALFDLGFADLRSITAYREFKTDSIYDQDATSLSIAEVYWQQLSDTFQQEFLLNGSIDRLDWTAGVFFFNMHTAYSPLDILATPPSPALSRRETQANVKSYAAYAQATYAITDEFRLTAGARYTKDESTVNGKIFTRPGNPLGPDVIIEEANDRKLSKGQVTWHFAADYQISPSVMIFASLSRGFKSGQFNLNSVTQAPTQPEILDSYQGGIKSDLFGNLARFNVTAFHYDYKDIQLSKVMPYPAGVQTLNAASGRLTGAEIELTLVPPIERGRLEIGSSFSLLDAKYRSFPDAPYFVPNPYTMPPPGVTCPAPSSASPGGNSSCQFDASGRRMIRAPKWTLGVNIDYSVPIADGELRLSANYYHNDGFFWEPSNRIRQKPYDVLNGQIAYSLPGDQWQIRVFGRNLTNQLYYSMVGEQALGDTFSAHPPRTYGIGVDYKF